MHTVIHTDRYVIKLMNLQLINKKILTFDILLKPFDTILSYSWCSNIDNEYVKWAEYIWTIRSGHHCQYYYKYYLSLPTIARSLLVGKCMPKHRPRRSAGGVDWLFFDLDWIKNNSWVLYGSLVSRVNNEWIRCTYFQ